MRSDGCSRRSSKKLNDASTPGLYCCPFMKWLLVGMAVWAQVFSMIAQSPGVSEPKLTARLTQEGLAIEAGSAGHFTLKFPVLVGERWDDVRKPIGTKVSGDSATLEFDGATRIAVGWKPEQQTLVFIPTNVPANMKSLRGEMLIDFNYVNGGTWQIGEGKETPFPLQQPARPHLFQGRAENLKLRNFEGATFTVQVPATSFQQLTDNREWNWKIFGWQFNMPCDVQAGPLEVKLTLGAPSETAVKLVDRFGQSTRANFPAKVKSEEELKHDLQTEEAWLARLQPPIFDRFGGLPGSGAKLGLKNSGFFHVEKKGQRWILVDPDGNAFFHLGVCAFGPSDDYTYFAGRERIFEWLPPHEGEFASAFNPDPYWNALALSFDLVNTIRKFGKPYDPATYTGRMIERVRKWGFNSAGGFGTGEASARRQMNFPHVAHLPLSTWEGFPDVPGVHGIFDPFSDKLREHCDRVFGERLSSAAKDPLLIGYFLANEPLWEEIPGAVAALDSSHACKQRLASFLEQKYRSVEAFNRAWGTSLGSFAQVAERGLPVKSDAAKADMQAFTGVFLDAYFRLVTETFHKYDKNHLLIGNRFQPGTINNETVCRLSGQYMDVVSFNYYTYSFDPQLLGRIRGWIGDRPMFFSEFYFSSPPDSGLIGGGQDLSSQRERGLAYRHYVEHAAALGYVVGIEWFTLVDQATTGRFFEKYNEEAANTGLISVADRPWKPMLEEMLKSNYDIYQVFFGERPAFEFNHPRFAAKTAERNEITGALLPAGFLRRRGSQIVGPDGVPVRVASVGLTGMNVVGGRLQLAGTFKGIDAHVAAMRSFGFNCVRVDWIDKTLDDPPAMSQLDEFVAACRKVGLKVIFDNHNNEATPADWENAAQQKNGLWFDTGPGTDGTDGAGNQGTVSAEKFQQDWVAFAKHWAGNPTVIGFDIRNEPCAHTKTPALWGDGGPTDIHVMYQSVGNAILAVNPEALISEIDVRTVHGSLKIIGWVGQKSGGAKPLALRRKACEASDFFLPESGV